MHGITVKLKKLHVEEILCNLVKAFDFWFMKSYYN